MKTSELNFTQIAEKVGYQNVYYFSKVFKGLNKITPSQYRELINQNLQNMGFKKARIGGNR
jgi:YesN/AraC family two-component response regulator